MFETVVVQPIFNLLVLIYAIVPGHDFGVAVILFTIIVRVLLWPLLKKQLHQTRLMHELQPQIKKIKQTTKGDKQKEAQLLMELYKEKGVSPFGSIGLLIVQLPILIGLFQGLRRLAENKQTIIDLSYSWVHGVGWMRQVTEGLNNFNETLFNTVDLTRSAFGEMGTYWPVLVIAALAAVMQFVQSKQLMPKAKDSRGLRQILRDETKGKQVSQTEINAAVSKNMRYFFPMLTFIFASSVPGALGLYWATGSLVGYLQQRSVLRHDVEEMEDLAEKKPKTQTRRRRSSAKRGRS